MPPSGVWIALLLAAVTFLVYWPSLKSDFVYDAREEILNERFITSLANLPAVLSLKVLGMNLMLGNRPGQLLYLMLIAAVSGREPFGYHLCSNLLHATNVALLWVLLLRLIAKEFTDQGKGAGMKVQFAAALCTLIFALHPISVETVAAVNYSSDLLVTFFTLVALLAATAFRPENCRIAMTAGALGTLCAFSAVASKESGIATALILIVYWFLFRRHEAKGPWLLFLGAATGVTAAFLTTRFLFAPPIEVPLSYLGGSFAHVFLIQPRLWVFMMGKLIWPAQLSGDYTLENLDGLSTPLAAMILIIVVLLQTWLAAKSRLGALGICVYWLGLVTVSNFIPLSRILGDRFYYLPMAGLTMQVLSLFLMTLGSRWKFWSWTAFCVAALAPLTLLTVEREAVFANDISLWTDTEQVSPGSAKAHCGLGDILLSTGRLDEAIAQFRRALEIDPGFALAHMNLGVALFQTGQVDDATTEFRKAVEIDPAAALAHNNLGFALFQKGRFDEAVAEYQKALALDPNFILAHSNLGKALVEKGRLDEAIFQFQEALRLKPDFREAQYNLAQVRALLRQKSGRN